MSLLLVRLLPIFMLAGSAMLYVGHVEENNDYLLRNLVPMLITVGLAVATLQRGGGRWTGSGWSWLLGTLGYSLPAIGLSLYLHYGYSADLDGMYSESIHPHELFRFLPVYTSVAGAVGFAIGWIAGRNV